MHVAYIKRALKDATLQNLRNYFTPDYINKLFNKELSEGKLLQNHWLELLTKERQKIVSWVGKAEQSVINLICM